MSASAERELRQAIGIRIRVRREIKRWTQVQLADRADLSQNMICLIEQGRATPSVFSAHRIADALGVSIGWLLRRRQERTER